VHLIWALTLWFRSLFWHGWYTASTYPASGAVAALESHTEDKKCILRIYHSFCSPSNLVYSLFCTDSFQVGEWTSAPAFSLAQKYYFSLSPRKSETYITRGTGTYSIRKSITSIILSYFKFHFRRRELFFTFWTFGHILLKLRELIKFNYP
jgi:hypothetical protein